MHMKCILQALFRDTPLNHIWRAQICIFCTAIQHNAARKNRAAFVQLIMTPMYEWPLQERGHGEEEMEVRE